MIPQLSLNNKSIVAAILGGKDTAVFWESRGIPGWLPLLLGLALGILLAFLIANQAWHFAVAVALAVPAIVLFAHYPFAAVMAWMLLFPYFVTTPTVTQRTIYWVLHRALIPAALGVAILRGWLGITKSRPVRLGRAELAMLVFLGWTLAGISAWNRSPVEAAIGFYDRLFVPFCAYWLIRVTAPTEKDLKRFLWVALSTLVPQCVIALFAWFAPQALPPQWILRTGRTVGSLANPAVYTSTLLFLALLLFQYAMNSRTKGIRYLLVVTLGLAISCVFLSFSRGSWLGCLTILLGLILIYPKTTLRLMIILVALVYVLSGSILADAVAWGSERLTGEASQGTVESRLITNNALLGMIRTKPLLGWGYLNSGLHIQQFMTQVGNTPAIEGYDVSSHNTYLTMMADLGMIGFFLYVFPALWWLMLSIRVRRLMPGQGFWSWRLLAMLWLLLLHMFIVTNFMDMVRTHPFGTTVWWIALGLIASMVYSYLKPNHIGFAGSARESTNA